MQNLGTFRVLFFSVFFILISLFLAPLSSIATAQTPDSLERREEAVERRKVIIDERLQRRQEIRERVEVQRATASARVSEARQQNIIRYFNNMSTRMLAMIDRLNNLTSRIETRLEIIEAEDEEIDTESVREKLESAKVLLDEAEADLLAAEDELESIFEANDPMEAFAIIRAVIHDVRDSLVQTHRLLVSTIGDIKGLRQPAEIEQ